MYFKRAMSTCQRYVHQMQLIALGLPICSTCFVFGSLPKPAGFSLTKPVWFLLNLNLCDFSLPKPVSLQPPPSQDSPKKIMESKGPAPNPPLSGEAQLKYENDRLKLALAQR